MAFRRIGWIASLVAAAAVVWTISRPAYAADGIEALKVGDTAEDYEWVSLGGDKVQLSELTSDGPVVLVVLRGFPGYQCPICSRQVADLRSHAEDFTRLGARVVLVYPGPADELQQRAEEFLRGAELPEPLVLVLDPDYSFTELYKLRWNAPRETAYPSTFVLDPNRVVKFAKISRSHGDRAKTANVLAALEELQKPDMGAGQ